MKFILKILAFTALLLISKFTKEDELITTPADSPQVIVNAKLNGAQQMPVHKTGGLRPEISKAEDPVETIIAPQATIK